MENDVRFAIAINKAIAGIFDEENENYIGILKKEDLNDFFYALMCLVPRRIFNKITWDDKDGLEILSVAQRLLLLHHIEDVKKSATDLAILKEKDKENEKSI